MSEVTAYIYPKCSTCRDAMKSLAAKGVSPEKIDLFETPPSKEELRRFWELSGLPLKKFLNTSGEVYKEMGLKDRIASMSDDEVLALMAANGRLIKRPIVVDGKRITVGFKEEQYKEIWS